MRIKKTKNRTAYRLAKELMGQKWRILIVLFSVITSAVLGLLYPHLLAEAINQIVAGAVSYTHLAVYKRQALASLRLKSEELLK